MSENDIKKAVDFCCNDETTCIGCPLNDCEYKCGVYLSKYIKENEPAAAATEASSECECVTSGTLDINNDNISKDFCQGLLDDIDTAIKMLMECVFGDESIYSSEKTAFDIGGAVRKLQDAYNRLEVTIFENT